MNFFWFQLDLLVFFLAAAGVLAVTPLFRILARKTGFLDVPASNHKAHAKATPLLGGLAMFSIWIAVLAGGFLLAFSSLLPGVQSAVAPHLAGLALVRGRLAVLILCALGTVLLGLLDDRIALPAWAKFLGQFVIAMTAVLGGGLRITLFCEVPAVQMGLSVFWLMLLMNSINFFDNMDGLAVGTIAIAMGLFTAVAVLNGQYFFALFSALNCGVCCGFWFYNANPATIFMGDSGSHFIGFLAAVTAVGVSYFQPARGGTEMAVLIPLFILALPLFDTAMVVVIRTCKGRPFWIGDHNHISHRFVRMGMSRRDAVLLVHLLALAVGLGGLPLLWCGWRTASILIAQAFFLLAAVTWIQFRAGHVSVDRLGDAAAKVPAPEK